MGLLIGKQNAMPVIHGGEGKRKVSVAKSAMVGSTYYGAIKDEDLEDGTFEIVGVVCLTNTNNRDYFNFGAKSMDETTGPYMYDCPVSILNLLSETDNEYALEWRKKCRAQIEAKKSKPNLGKLPIGTVIEFNVNGETHRFTKHAPAFQFKTPFWYNGFQYIPKNRIPDDFRIVS